MVARYELDLLNRLLLALFAEAVLESDLPDAGLFAGQAPTTWDADLRLLARCLPEELFAGTGLPAPVRIHTS